MSATTAERRYPLSPTQHGMLFHHLENGAVGVDVEQIVGRIPGAVDADVLREAWRRLADRHDALRTEFRWDDREEPEQVVRGSVVVPFTAHDLDGRPGGDDEDPVRERMARRRAEGFDLSEAPLFRVDLFRDGDEESVLLWTFHHTILDGRSFPLALRELFEIYDALTSGEEPSLPEPVPFERHVRWLEEDLRPGGEDDRRFWRRRLSGFDAPTPLPYEALPDGDRGEEGAGRGEVERRLARETTDRLRDLAGRADVTLNTVVQAAWALLLARFADVDDVVFGAARAGRGGSFDGADEALGMFMNTVPVRVPVDPEARLGGWLAELRERDLDVRPHEHAPLADVQRWSDVAPGEPLFRSLVIYDHASLDGQLEALGEEWEEREFRLHEDPGYPLGLYAYGEPELLLKLGYDRGRYDEGRARGLLDHLATLLRGMAEGGGRAVGDLPLLPDEERCRLLEAWNDTDAALPEVRIHELFEQRAAGTPDRVALAAGDEELTYGELNGLADRICRRLTSRGVGRGDVVGICLPRTPELVASLLGVHKAGAAYLPLDPSFPDDRLEYMARDASAAAVLAGPDTEHLVPGDVVTIRPAGDDTDGRGPDARDVGSAEGGGDPSDLAYVIYTSGSTGRPKGVEVEHRNAVNFFRGMEDRVGGPPSTWLAVTSLSFDISLLELYWTLTRGDRVVLLPGEATEALPGRGDGRGDRREADADLGFSLFFFGGDASRGDERYGLLMDAARWADRNGLEAVWTPERHFHEFGGPYPNPSVTGAALAAATDRIDIRAGSVVLPLQDPLRVVEEWSVVDGLSDGRTAVAFASGWQPEDFVLAPDRHEERKEWMFREIETVRKLWRGETVEREGPDGKPVELRTFPPPVQDELPVWVTAAGSPETFRRAGEIGAGVLTHMLGQDLDELAEKIDGYRRARREAGHPGDGHVTVMLHAFLGPDDEAVRDTVRGPLKGYLQSSVSLLKKYADEWTAYRGEGGGSDEARGDEFERLSDEDRDALLEHAFERYYTTSGLFGTPESCLPLLDDLEVAGADEVAALVDFGVDAERVMEGLEHLGRLRRLRASASADGEAGPTAPDVRRAGPDGAGGEPEPDGSIPSLIRRHGVTHLQCTPSLLRLLLADGRCRDALSELDRLLVGGEAFSPELAGRALEAVGDGEVHNMYGPTETTVWSTTRRAREEDTAGRVPIGRPVANTRVYVLDRRRRPVPAGVPGELHIGGEGVARGYRGRPELTAGAFLEDPFVEDCDARMYRTGDRVLWREDGVLEFRGRVDRQVKVRGHRVEPGEVEAGLAGMPAVEAAAVRLLEGGDPRLGAWVTVPDGGDGAAPELREVREFLRGRLPDYMLPSALTVLDEMPLTPNGKIDHGALPDPDAGPADGDGAADPRTPLEADLAGIWEDVLGVESVGVDDDFFELGGSSLSTIQVAFRIREALGVEVPLRSFFRTPTVAGLARTVEAELLKGADAEELEAMIDEVGDLSAEEARRRLRSEASDDAAGRPDGEGESS